MKNWKKIVWAVTMFCLKVGCCYAQKPDSVGNWKLHIDLRSAIIKGKNIQMWGGTVGRTFGSLGHEVTMGYYWLGANGRERLAGVERRAAIENNATSYSSPDWYYGSVGYWHNIINSQRWKLSVPLEVGLGKYKDRYRSVVDGRHLTIDRKIIVPLQLGGCIEWKATRWAGIGLQVGYRYDLGHANVPEMNAFFYRTRFILYPLLLFDTYARLVKKKPIPSIWY